MQLYTRKQTARFLGMSLSTLDKARISGQIAFVRYTERGGVYFTDGAIRDYLEICTHPTNDDISITAGTGHYAPHKTTGFIF